MAAAAQGITLLFSSGDDGDLSQDNGVVSNSYEATSPYVTGVGGTSLPCLPPMTGKRRLAGATTATSSPLPG